MPAQYRVRIGKIDFFGIPVSPIDADELYSADDGASKVLILEFCSAQGTADDVTFEAEKCGCLNARWEIVALFNVRCSGVGTHFGDENTR
jgi:hypothetical protein